jgi:hypothetical protein
MNQPGSYNLRSSYLGKPEAGYCLCGKRSGGRGSRGFCSVDCRFWSKVQMGPTCWLWIAGHHTSKRTREPYGQCYYKGRGRRAHIVAWALSHDGILPDVSSGGLGVLHRCDTPLCVRPDHLFLGTPLDNMRDAAAKGRLHIARPGRQKVSPEDIAVIRSRVAAGELQKVVAADFGIARNTVSQIIHGHGRQYDAPLVPALVQLPLEVA